MPRRALSVEPWCVTQFTLPPLPTNAGKTHLYFFLCTISQLAWLLSALQFEQGGPVTVTSHLIFLWLQGVQAALALLFLTWALSGPTLGPGPG